MPEKIESKEPAKTGTTEKKKKAVIKKLLIIAALIAFGILLGQLLVPFVLKAVLL